MLDKACRRCGERKPVDGFYCDRSRSDGLTPECALCRRQMNHDSYVAHRLHRIADAMTYHGLHRQEIIERKRRRYAALREQKKP
jgi:hypothetical protein